MPKRTDVEKRQRQNEKARDRSKRVKSRLTTFTRQFEDALESGDLERARDRLREVESEWDSAASKGIVPQNRG
ncbi:MAG: 30S ribosomal protein S20 [Bradymonadaceae bacterium]